MASSFFYLFTALGICVLIAKVTKPTYIIDESEFEIPEWVNFPSSVEQLDLNDMLREIIESQLYINGFRGKKLDDLSNDLMMASIIYAKGCVNLTINQQN